MTLTSCAKCGASVAENQNFCPNCGSPVSRGAESLEVQYCTNCGAKLPSGAEYCVQCGTSRSTVGQPVRTLTLASWGRRFVAWLIDIVIFAIIPSGFFAGWRFEVFPFFGVGSIIPFIYWTLLEGYMGQSVGKLALDLRVTRVDGGRITFAEAAIESFGKAFILPVDIVVGWIFFNEKRQRLFNKLSNTIVIHSPKQPLAFGTVEYRRA
ncbi:MAG: zinc-ribbon domain-containing protein [Candidatus Bathyarchaeia archaeon]